MQDRAEKIQYLGNSWLRSGLKSFCLLFVVVVVVFSYSWQPLWRGLIEYAFVIKLVER